MENFFRNRIFDSKRLTFALFRHVFRAPVSTMYPAQLKMYVTELSFIRDGFIVAV